MYTRSYKSLEMKTLSLTQTIARMALVVLSLNACVAKSEKVPGQSKIKKFTNTGRQDWDKKQDLDKLMKARKHSIEVFVSRVGEDSVHRVIKGEFPDSIRTTYNLLRDESGRLRVAAEFPFSESGDWSIRLAHYFDESGRTFAFERHTIFFNSLCTPGMASETRSFYFDTMGRKTDSLYLLLDHEENPLQKEDCQFPIDYSFTIQKTSKSWLAARRIPQTEKR